MAQTKSFVSGYRRNGAAQLRRTGFVSGYRFGDTKPAEL